MIKLIQCLRRRDDVSIEDFLEYWDRLDPLREDLVHSLGAVRLVKNRLLHVDANEMWAANRARAQPFDGVLEVWFESGAGLEAAKESPAFKVLGERLFEAGNDILDRERSTFFFVQEEVVFSGDDDGASGR